MFAEDVRRESEELADIVGIRPVTRTALAEARRTRDAQEALEEQLFQQTGYRDPYILRLSDEESSSSGLRRISPPRVPFNADGSTRRERPVRETNVINTDLSEEGEHDRQDNQPITSSPTTMASPGRHLAAGAAANTSPVLNNLQTNIDRRNATAGHWKTVDSEAQDLESE